MARIRYVIWVWMLWGCAQNLAFSQTPYFRKFSVDEGLSSNIIYDILQDDKGYVWFATDNGVSRFDGYGFSNFNLKDGLADNEVVKLRQDSRGRIWFLSLIGKFSFFHNDTFYHAGNCSFLANMPKTDGYFSQLAEWNDNLYFASNRGDIYKLNPDSQFTHIQPQEGAAAIWSYDNALYILTRTGRHRLLANDLLVPVPTRHVGAPLPSGIRISEAGKMLLMGAGNRLIILDQQTNSIILDYSFADKEMDIIATYLDHAGRIWVGTRQGLYRASGIPDAAEGNWIRFIDNSLVTNIIEDNEYNFWVSTMGNACFFIPNANIFWLYSPYREARNQITTTVFVDRQNRLWTGHDKSSYTIRDGTETYSDNLGKPKNLERISRIKSIGKEIWIIGKSKIRVIDGDKRYDLAYFGNDVLLDHNGYYWIASSHVYRVKGRNARDLINQPKPSSRAGDPNTEVMLPKRANVLYEDESGGIWLGTFDGLYYYDGNRFYNFGDSSVSLTGKINDLKKDPQSGNLLVATDNFGITELDTRNLRIIPGGFFAELNRITCFSITLRGHEYWLGTNKGILYLTRDSNKAGVHYSELLGITNLHVFDIAFIGENLYAATSSGLLRFDEIGAADIRLQPPPVYLTSVSHKGKTVMPAGKAVFPYSENELTLTFKGMSFKEMGNLSYRYKLEGLDEDFQMTSNREVVLKALPPGEYVFTIYAINRAGQASDTPASFAFTIRRPYWQQWWFILVIAGSGFLIFSVLWRLRLSIVRRGYELENARLDEEKRRLQLENKLSEVEQHALRLQMNPHFIFNALNSIKGYYAEKRINEADEYLSRFSKILRHILENNERYSSLQEEIDILRLYLEMAQMRHPGMFDYRIRVEEGINTGEMTIPSMLLQPFVENAIIHGIAPKQEEGFIDIALKREGDILTFTITDNGIGLSIARNKQKNKEHQSKAIEITRKRLEYINQQEEVSCTIEIRDDTDGSAIHGTVVSISLPTKNLW